MKLPTHEQAMLIRKEAISKARTFLSKDKRSDAEIGRIVGSNFQRKLFCFPSDLPTERIIKALESLKSKKK